MGQRVALTIRLHYHAETHSAKQRQGARNDLTSTPNGVHVRTSKKLSELAHAGEGSVIRALEVYKKRTDLFGKIFDGSYTIGKAHTQMKLDENPPTTEEERQEELNERSTQLSVRQPLQLLADINDCVSQRT